MRRQPAVAGQFYPGEAQPLRRMLGDLIGPETGKQAAIGVIAPHAGYVYSGRIAGQTFGRVAIPETVVILGPNHHGVGQPGAVFSSGSWVTPLGEVPVDAELAAALLAEVPGLTDDPAAHRLEHSLEVEVPFLQHLAPDAAIVPICLGHLPLPSLLRMGEAMGELLAARDQPVLLAASSDMTHYEPGPDARAKDMKAIDRVLALDPEGLYQTVRENRITMCGVIPVVVMLAAVRRLGAVRAELVEYGNSGDVTGDQRQVVGYAGVVIS